MDSIPDREFMDLFDRFSLYVDVKDCETPEDIVDSINASIRLMKRITKKAKRKRTVKRWNKKIKLLRVLKREGYSAKSPKLKGKTRMGIQTRIIEHARLHPRRAIALTLRYGKKRAVKILRERKKRKISEYARR